MSTKPWVPVLAAALLLAGCGNADKEPPPVPDVGLGNGTAYLLEFGDEQSEVRSAAIAEDGALAEARPVTTGPGIGNRFVSVLDGLGDLTLVGDFTDFSTTEVRLLKGETTVATIPAEGWCGGEDLIYSVCLLLDADRMVRTTTLGYRPGPDGFGSPEGSVIVSSLTDASTLQEFGPFPGLVNMLPTPSADEVIIVTEQQPGQIGPQVVSRLSLKGGSTREIGTSDGEWNAICRLGETSVLGFQIGETDRLSVVGSGEVADIAIEPGTYPRGCSLDGRFVYLLRDAETSTLVRVDLANGDEATLLELSQTGVLVTR